MGLKAPPTASTTINDSDVPGADVKDALNYLLDNQSDFPDREINLGNAPGTKFGTATIQKLSFWNKTPIIQPADANQAAVASQTQEAITDNTGGSVDTTLVSVFTALSVGADVTKINSNFADLASQLSKIKSDIANIKTFQNQIRTDLINTGLIKGEA